MLVPAALLVRAHQSPPLEIAPAWCWAWAWERGNAAAGRELVNKAQHSMVHQCGVLKDEVRYLAVRLEPRLLPILDDALQDR